MFLVGADGEQLGVQPLPEALAQAREQELDLVEVAPNANPPVCRIMDYGRYVYEQEQRRRQSKRKATNVVIKEMKFRPKIDEHDYTTKMKHVVRFLGEGNKVKLTIMFRGREMAHPELGLKILRRVADDVADFAMVESEPRQDGRNMTMVLHPIRKDGRKPSTSRPPAAGRRESTRRNGARGPGGTRTRSCVMPKMKTHRGAAKRFKVTGTGKIMRRKANRAPPAREEAHRSARVARPPGRGHRRRQEARRAPARPRLITHHHAQSPRDDQEPRWPGSSDPSTARSAAARSSPRPRGTAASRSRSLRKANEQVMHSGNYAYRDRRARKGEFRRLWIVRINAACRENDISYSRFVAGLKAAEIEVDRKILADLAVRDSAAFGALVSTAREALEAA